MRKQSERKARKKPTITTTHRFDVGRYGCSMIGLGGLEATAYTLFQIVVDVSGSTTDHQEQVGSLLKEIVKSWAVIECKHKVLLRIVAFDNDVKEIHGFQPLPLCEGFAYEGVLTAAGNTALYDATLNGVESAVTCGRFLMQNDYLCNGLLVVVTDGADNLSATTPRFVTEAIGEATKADNLESFTSVLIGLCDSLVGKKVLADSLTKFVDKAGLSRYIEVDDLSDFGFKQLAEAITDLLDSVVQSLGTGELPKDHKPPNRFHLGERLVEMQRKQVDAVFPNIAKWVKDGWIKIGDQDGRGFAARALDSGGVVFENEKCRTLVEAMESLETGIAKWLGENG